MSWGWGGGGARKREFRGGGNICIGTHIFVSFTVVSPKFCSLLFVLRTCWVSSLTAFA